jgi:hypothetical protein
MAAPRLEIDTAVSRMIGLTRCSSFSSYLLKLNAGMIDWMKMEDVSRMNQIRASVNINSGYPHKCNSRASSSR